MAMNTIFSQSFSLLQHLALRLCRKNKKKTTFSCPPFFCLLYLKIWFVLNPSEKSFTCCDEERCSTKANGSASLSAQVRCQWIHTEGSDIFIVKRRAEAKPWELPDVHIWTCLWEVMNRRDYVSLNDKVTAESDNRNNLQISYISPVWIHCQFCIVVITTSRWFSRWTFVLSLIPGS